MLAMVFVVPPASQAERKPFTVVALGDSTTAGTPFPNGAYTRWILERHADWVVHNRGVNAQRSDQVLARFEDDVLKLKPDVVVVLAGVNDLFQGRSASEVQRNLERLYGKAKAAGIQVAACTILPYNRMKPGVLSQMRQVNRWIERYAERHDLLFCDTYALLENPDSPGTLSGSADGLHPDLNGYRDIGEAVTDTLEIYQLNKPL